MWCAYRYLFSPYACNLILIVRYAQQFLTFILRKLTVLLSLLTNTWCP